AVTHSYAKMPCLRVTGGTSGARAPADHGLLFFVDDNIASNRVALKELCRALIPMRVSWVSQASLDVTSDREAMQLMVDAGCLGHIMGFESITRASIKEARKSPNMPRFDQYATQIRILREYGLQTSAAFTLGYD